MNPKIIECPKCESRFDVSSFEPGSKFDCASCRNVILVPAEAPEVAKPTARRKRRPEGWGKAQPTGPVSVPGARSRPGGGVPVPSPSGQRGGGVPIPAPAGRKGGVPEPRASVPGRAPPVARSSARAADTRRAAAVDAVSSREDGPPRRVAREAGGGGGSPLPLLLGLAGLAVAVIVVIAIAMSGGDGGGEAPVVPVAEGGPIAGPSRTEDGNPDRWSDARRREFWANTLRLKPIGQKKAAAARVWRENHAWAERYGLLDLAQEALAKLLEVDSEDRWANEKMGRKLFQYRYPTEDGLPLEEFPWARKAEISKYVEKNGKDGKVWVTPEKFDELTRLQELETAHQDRIAKDAKYRITRRSIESARHDPGFAGLEFEIDESFPPYLLFVPSSLPEVDAAEIARTVRRTGLILKRLHRGWEEIVQPEIRKISGYEDFTLPKLGEVTGDAYHVLRVWVFPSEKDFRAHLEKNDQTVPAGAGAHYSPENQWLTLHAGPGGEPVRHDKQDAGTGTVFGEGARQILHLYTRLVMGERYARMGEGSADFSDIIWRAPWFTEGLAEMFGGADEIRKDEAWEVFRPHHRRIREYRRALTEENRASGYYWTLDELVRISGRRSLTQAARLKSLNPRVVSRLEALFRAEAWTFCHFLWFGQQGKYRSHLVRYLIKELEGSSGLDVFRQILKDAAPNGDFSGLEREMQEHLGTLPNVRPDR